jgi:hypothetical protein
MIGTEPFHKLSALVTMNGIGDGKSSGDRERGYLHP